MKKVLFIIFSIYSLDLFAQFDRNFDWQESNIYIKPLFGMIVFGSANVNLNNEYIDDYSPNGYDYFPTFAGVAAGRKISSNLFVELEMGYTNNYGSDDLKTDKESHVLFAVGPVYYIKNSSIVTPRVSASVGGSYSQYNTDDFRFTDEFVFLIDKTTSPIVNLGAGVGIEFFDEIDFGVEYKLMFMTAQKNLILSDGQVIDLGTRINHRFESFVKLGTNIF